jgi:hypothetical protein
VALSAFLTFLADRFSFTVRPGFLAAELRGELSDTMAPHSDRRAVPGDGGRARQFRTRLMRRSMTRMRRPGGP